MPFPKSSIENFELGSANMRSPSRIRKVKAWCKSGRNITVHREQNQLANHKRNSSQWLDQNKALMTMFDLSGARRE